MYRFSSVCIVVFFVVVFFTEAAYRFYKSKCEEESAKQRGKLPFKNRLKRRHERLHRVSGQFVVQFPLVLG